MDLLSGDISHLVFRRSLKQQQGDFSLDRRMLSVFMELDGKKSLGTIAGHGGLTMSAVREIITRLVRMNLIESVPQEKSVIDQDFVDFLKSQLALSVGPIAGILIEDEIERLGYSPSAFPCRETLNLVNRLAMEIRREDKKRNFVLQMKYKIQAKGYRT